jgi:FAD/FMN-containing dehydrogenase
VAQPAPQRTDVSEDFVPGQGPGIRRQNWKGTITYHARAVEVVDSVDDIVRIVKDRDRYPSPVRAAGSQHSKTHCIDAEQGTIVDVTRMNRILAIDSEALTITMQAGVLHIDAAKALEQRGLQFHVNIELGNMTVGSGACCGTKESAFPGGYGQVCSYLIAARLVLPSGELLHVTEAQPELLRAVRSSYGMLGILYEVTFRVRRLQAMAVRHVAYSVDELAERLPALTAQGESMMLYMFPFIGKVVVEYRRYVDGEVSSHWQWRLRNFVWATFAPLYAAVLTKILPRPIRYWCFNTFARLNVVTLTWLVKGSHTSPADQIIRYPKQAGLSAYTFSIWTFPESEYARSIRAYFRFCQEYSKQHGFRTNMLSVGYRVSQDSESIFSYTAKEGSMTLDPVSTGDPGWEAFLDAYNQFSMEYKGVPLFNQSPQLTPAQAKAALGPQIERFQAVRRQYDPTDRMYPAFFRGLFE